MTKPAPGSDAAFAIGCTCPKQVVGDHYPRIERDCPIHAEIVATVEHVWDHAAGGPVKIVRPVHE